jgi:hypothetical protein
MHLFRFEHRSEPIAPRHRFLGRVLANIGVAFVVIGAFVVAGAAAYHFFLRPDGNFWNAIHRASMIITGMGPVEPPGEGPEKAFVDVYAIISTLVLTAVLGIVLAPFVHRVMHYLHIPDEDNETGKHARPNHQS